MTRDQDIERVLDRWLTEGPTQMPRRFLDDTLDRVDRVPQHRLARLRSRLPVMNPMLRWAAAAAVVLAAVGLGAAALTQKGVIGSPPSAGSGVLPASLQAEWHPVGTRDLPGLSGPLSQSLDIVIAPQRVTVFDYHVDVLNSASLVGPDRIEVRALNMGKYWHCQVGDAGTYTFRLSAEDKLLTLSPVSDSCAERATILGGDWTRTELGDIAPGSHVSQVFRPFGGGTSGQFSYSVPTGWAESEGTPAGLALWIPGASDGPSIRVLSNVVPVSNSDPGCVGIKASIQQSPAAIAAWLADQPGFVVSTPAPVAIGGLSGVMVDLSVDTAVVACSSLFVDFENDLATALSGERRARYIVLDRGDGQILLIAIEQDKATWDAAIANAMPVVRTFEFAR